MKNFNNSWRKFLNESSRTENVPFKDTRVRIKLENKKKLLYEVSEDEFEHIEAAIEKMADLNELAFNDIFGDKTRMVIDFPTLDVSTPLGRFIAMWGVMGYEVDWTKGMLSSERALRDTSPAAFAADLMGTAGVDRVKPKKITMKIGKWFSKMLSYTLKYNAMREKVREHAGGDRYTGNDIKAALGENGEINYYRLSDTIDMMLKTNETVTPQYIKVLRKPEKLEELSRYWRDNAADIKKNLDKAQSNEYSIVITRNPIDVWRMSDFQNITSCHTPPSRGGGGEYYKCAVAEAHGHGAVAYAVDTDELLQATGTETIEEAEEKLNQYNEIFYDDERTWGGPEIELRPDMRVRLRQVRFFENAEDYQSRSPRGVQIAVPEKRTYGAQIPGFNERIVQWAREVQEEQISQAPKTKDGKLKLDDFIKFGGSHDDNPISLLLKRLFGDAITGTDGYVHVDRETEDEIEAEIDLTSGMVNNYQREIDTYKEEWNQRYAHTEVDGDAIDDGGGGVYITCGATLYINWDASEWTRMPDARVNSYGLNEVQEYGLGWVVDHPAWGIRKIMNGEQWQLPIVVKPEGLAGFGAQEYAWDPDNFNDFCAAVDVEVDDRYDMVKAVLTTFFKREGYMEGGAVMELGRKVMNGDTGLYHWEAFAEESHEPDEYEFIQFTAHPEVWYNEFNVSEEEAMRIMQDRNFWLEIRRRMAAPAFENTDHEMYPQMPLDMDMFGEHGTEGESQELNLYFSVHGEDPDEMVQVLEELVNIWDDQDEINRVATEVFGDMLQGRVALDGTSVVDLSEEKSLSDVEQILKRLNEIEDMQPATEEAAEADLDKWLADNNISRGDVDIEDSDLNPAGEDSAVVEELAKQAEELGSVDQGMIDDLCKTGIKKRVLIAKDAAGDKIVDGKHRFIAAHKCKIALPATYISRNKGD